MWPSTTAVRSTCSSPSRLLAPWGSASSHCSAPETPAPHCASCQRKAENLIVWPTERLLSLGLGKAYSFRGSCTHASSGNFVKHCPPTYTVSFLPSTKTSAGLQFPYPLPEMHPFPPPRSWDTSPTATSVLLPNWSLPFHLLLFQASAGEQALPHQHSLSVKRYQS